MGLYEAFTRPHFVKRVAAVLGGVFAGEALAEPVTISISITDSDGLNLQGTVQVIVTASPLTNLSRVELYVDGVLYGTDAATPYTFNWDTTQVGDGSHTLKAIAYYKTRKSTAQMAVTVNNAAPPPPPPPPPPTGTLKWRPPGWNGNDPTLSTSFPGYIVLNVSGTTATNLTLDDATDYYINLGDLTPAPAPSGRTYCLSIAGGRNVVIVGGRIFFEPNRIDDDAVAIVIDDGNPTGVVHLEGLDIKCLNGPTSRTPRTVQIQNCYIKVDNSPYGRGVNGLHPDIVQAWARYRNRIKMHRVTGHSNFTGLSVLVDPLMTPLSWETYDFSMHPEPSTDVAWPDIHPARWWGYDTDHTGANNWIATDKFSSTGLRKLDDVLIQYAFGGSGGIPTYAPYEIHDPAGTLIYTSPLVPTGGNGPYPQGATQGCEIRYTRVQSQSGHPIDETWKYGLNPAWTNGEVCPQSTVGVSYVSPRYV